MSCAISEERIRETIDFHGHSCPGLTIGIRAAELALNKLGTDGNEALVVVTETDMCGVDAIQFLTGCTYGKGNFIHRDLGKMAFSFHDRRTGSGFRALLRPEARGALGGELAELMRREARGEATTQDGERVKELRASLQKHFLALPLEEMFEITEQNAGTPRPPRILESLACDCCGEMTMESRTRRFGGETLCIPCFEAVEQKR